MLNLSNRNTAKIEQLYKLADENRIPIDKNCPPNLISMSVRLSDGRKIIGLSNDETTTHTKLECLAHEMGHCMTDSFYSGYSPFELRAKHENKANNWAINEIIPFAELCDAVKNGYRDLWELADFFNVSKNFIEKAINTYAQHGKIVPVELYADSL